MIGLYEIERIYSVNATLQIVRSNNERDTRCGFRSHDAINEWDEIIIENDYETRLFAGIMEQPGISKADNITVYDVETRGYKKIFDRTPVEEAYDNELAGDIVKDIVATNCPGFTTEGVEDGTTIAKVVFNNVLNSEGIKRIADSLGYQWGIDAYKVVSFGAPSSSPAPRSLTTGENFYKNLKITPDVSNLCNVVIVRGGTYLSEEVIYKKVADGEETQFVLPEKPHDVSVYVNGVEKTVGVKFGEQPATAEFQINFNEKYIENGTYATLSSGDVMEVRYKYDVPIRVRRKNLASIAALQVLFPETNGEFVKVIHDPDISTRELAYDVAQQNLDAYSNALVEGSFSTIEDIFSPGQLLSISVPEFTGSSVIQKITSKHIAGSLWNHTVTFATVLFGFEEFMRELLAAKKVELIDGETLETSTDVDESLTFADTVTALTGQIQPTESVEITDEAYQDLNAGIEFVLAPYWPTDFTDTKRVFILDGSPLG